jgi:integrase
MQAALLFCLGDFTQFLRRRKLIVPCIRILTHSQRSLPVNCIDFVENKITFPSPKGGEDRAFSVPMPTALRPLLERIRKSKQKFTVEFPFQPSRRWQQFFIKIKKTHLTFHCLRVTYVNRLRRAGVPREAVMRLVNHASELIHQIYQREKVEDVAQWRDAVQFAA